PVLEGTDGVQKMSKSLGNQIGIADPPEEMYGKVMSISDTLMRRYAELLGTLPEDRLASIREGDVHPMDAKKELARELVARFHGADAAAEAGRFFEERFQKRTAHRPRAVQPSTDADEAWIGRLLKGGECVWSSSQ